MVTVQVLHFQINNKNNVSQIMLLFCDEGLGTDWEACLHSQRVCTKCQNGNT